MKGTAKLFQIVMWATLILAGPHLNAAKEPLQKTAGL
jgi:hypothetical protein